MPLDPEPVGYGFEVRAGEPGNVVLRDGIAHTLGVGKRAGADEAVYVPHFASCPRRTHGARDRPTAVDAAHERLDCEAERAAAHDRADERPERNDPAQRAIRDVGRKEDPEPAGEPPPERGPREVAIALRRVERVVHSLVEDLERWERRGR
jgi:hypothetical protein